MVMNSERLADQIGVYIHIPFCASRCSYCDFNTNSGMDDYIETYIETLCKEMGSFFSTHKNREADSDRKEVISGAGSGDPIIPQPAIGTVFIGGGTPSYIGSEYIKKIIDKLYEKTGASLQSVRQSGQRFEFTIEANPGTLTYEKLLSYSGLGINRLSLGLQSTQENLLKLLGRIHSFEDFTENIKTAKQIGFNNINADLIFGIPRQTMENWVKTLAAVVKTGVTHLSCYSLSVEKGTKLSDMVESKMIPEPDEELDRQMYHYAVDYLRGMGYNQYEISNFALPGYECRHNLKYWTCGEYIGFGAGAHSYLQGTRFSNETSVTDYIAKINEFGSAVVTSLSEKIGRDEQMKEYIILRLRLTAGFNVSGFEEEFGAGFFEIYGETVKKLEQNGLLEVRKTANSECEQDSGWQSNYNIRLTKKGMDFANIVFMEFI